MTARGEPSMEAYRERIGRCLAFVQEHIQESLRLEDLAAAADFSKYHFHRIFSALVGETPADYVKRLRLERAAGFLKTRPSLSMSELARECGFSSPSVFAREFRAAFHMTPSRYRLAGRITRPPVFPAPRPFPAKTLAGISATGAPAAGRIDEGFTLKTLGPFSLAQVMHAGGYGSGIGLAWQRLFAWAGRAGLRLEDARMVGIAWDNPEVTPPSRCRYSACLAVSAGTKGSGPVTILELPVRPYLTLRYRGRESGLSAAYQGLYHAGLIPSGLEPDDAPSLEFHLARPSRERDPLFDLELAVPVVPLR